MRAAIFRFKPFSTKQRKVLNWWCGSSPVRNSNGMIADGAIRSGKTVSMALSFALWAMESFNGENLAMCGKTIGSFRRNVLFPLKLMLRSRGYSLTERRTDNLLVVKRGIRENYFYMFGGKDERSQDLIQGITLAGLFCDEVALMPESFVNQAAARCSVDGSKLWFNCNPANPQHWFKTGWIDKRSDKGLLYLHFTMEDNLSLSENVKQRYRSLYSGVFYRRYIEGLWVAAEGVIYRGFAENTGRYLIDEVPDDILFGALGLDWGGNGSAHAASFVGITKGFRRVVLLDEYYRKEVITPEELFADICAFVRRCKARYPTADIYCDSAETTLGGRGTQRTIKPTAAKTETAAGTVSNNYSYKKYTPEPEESKEKSSSSKSSASSSSSDKSAKSTGNSSGKSGNFISITSYTPTVWDSDETANGKLSELLGSGIVGNSSTAKAITSLSSGGASFAAESSAVHHTAAETDKTLTDVVKAIDRLQKTVDGKNYSPSFELKARDLVVGKVAVKDINDISKKNGGKSPFNF